MITRFDFEGKQHTNNFLILMYTRKGYYQDREIDPFVTGVSCEQNKIKLVIMDVK